MVAPSEAAALVHDHARRSVPAVGGPRLVCIDGPAGSGKTTIATALAELEPEVGLVHMDDLYEGWTGLPTVADQLATLLPDLARGRAGRYRRYDWYAGARAEQVTVPPTSWVVIEGVGAGHRRFAELHTLLVWVTAPLPVRHERWLDREGSDEWWEHWRRAEEHHFARDDTRSRADLVLPT